MKAGTEHPPSCLVPPPGDGVSAVSGFGTHGEVLSLGLGTATALQWGWQHDVQSPAPFAGGMAVGGGSSLFSHPAALSWGLCTAGDSGWERSLLQGTHQPWLP